MDSLVINAKSLEDRQLFLDLAKRLKAKISTIEEIEDQFLGKMIEESLESGMANRDEVLKKLCLK